MKKHHIKAIQSQAQYLRKIVKDIESLKRGRKLIGGEWFIYPKQVRVHIVKQNGNYYKPSNIKTAIAGMDDVQMAKLMRLVYTQTTHKCGGASDFCRVSVGRFPRIYGNFFDVKNTLCKELFKKKIWYLDYKYKDDNGEEYTLYQFYTMDKYGCLNWDEDKLTLNEAMQKYHPTIYNWKKINN